MATRLLETLPDPAEGLAGPDFYAYFLNQKNLFEYNDQQTLDFFRTWMDFQYGRGVVGGTYASPLLSDGGGLTLNIGAHTSIIQQFITLVGTTVWVFPDDSVMWIWELQTNTDDAPQYLLVPDETDPSTDDLPAILLGKVTTVGGVITEIEELFNIINLGNILGTSSTTVIETFGPDEAGIFIYDWDADPDDRTGGTTPLDITLSQPATTINYVQRGEGEAVNLVKNVAWTAPTTSTIRIADGFKPIIRTDTSPEIHEKIIVSYNILNVPTYTPSILTVEDVFGPDEASVYEKDWDSDPDTRTGGTDALFDLMLSQSPDVIYSVERGYGESINLISGVGYTIPSPGVIRIEDGFRPIIRTDVSPNIKEKIIIKFKPALP